MTTPAAPEPTVSTRVLTRVVILLLAVWNSFAGLVLVAFHGASSDALGAGVEDEGGQRLVGVHMLVLVPAYLLLAWRPDRYRAFMWLPYAAQLGVVVVVSYDMISGATDFDEGILALAVGIIFVALLAFLWITEQRTAARLKIDQRAAESEAGEPAGPQP